MILKCAKNSYYLLFTYNQWFNSIIINHQLQVLGVDITVDSGMATKTHKVWIERNHCMVWKLLSHKMKSTAKSLDTFRTFNKQASGMTKETLRNPVILVTNITCQMVVAETVKVFRLEQSALRTFFPQNYVSYERWNNNSLSLCSLCTITLHYFSFASHT